MFHLLSRGDQAGVPHGTLPHFADQFVAFLDQTGHGRAFLSGTFFTQSLPILRSSRRLEALVFEHPG
jgi:hypothetical protein